MFHSSLILLALMVVIDDTGDGVLGDCVRGDMEGSEVSI